MNIYKYIADETNYDIADMIETMVIKSHFNDVLKSLKEHGYRYRQKIMDMDKYLGKFTMMKIQYEYMFDMKEYE